MTGFFGTLISLSLKLLGAALAINIVILICKGGRKTMRDLRDTILMAIKLVIDRAKKWLTSKYMESEKGKEENSGA